MLPPNFSPRELAEIFDAFQRRQQAELSHLRREIMNRLASAEAASGPAEQNVENQSSPSLSEQPGGTDSLSDNGGNASASGAYAVVAHLERQILDRDLTGSEAKDFLWAYTGALDSVYRLMNAEKVDGLNVASLLGSPVGLRCDRCGRVSLASDPEKTEPEVPAIPAGLASHSPPGPEVPRGFSQSSPSLSFGFGDSAPFGKEGGDPAAARPLRIVRNSPTYILVSPEVAPEVTLVTALQATEDGVRVQRVRQVYGPPSEWAHAALDMWVQFGAREIVHATNSGSDLVRHLLVQTARERGMTSYPGVQ